MKVEELMTTDVGACRPFDSVDRGAKVMWERDCGAVPVVDQEGRVIAMLSMRDLLRDEIEEQVEEIRHLRAYVFQTPPA